jgi:hypothetical protein
MASRKAARAMTPVRVAENLKLRAEAQLAAAERAVGSADQLAAAKAELQPKLDAVAPAREAAVAAETARVVAADVARKVARDLAPVSVFISRKTQLLYVVRPFNLSWRALSRSGMPIVRLALTSSPRGLVGWADLQMVAWSSRTAPSAKLAVETQSWSRPICPPRNTGRRHTGSADRGKATISSAWGNDKMPCQQSPSPKTK